MFVTHTILVIIKRFIIQFYINRCTLRQIYELPKISHKLLSPLIYGNNKCNSSFLFIAHGLHNFTSYYINMPIFFIWLFDFISSLSKFRLKLMHKCNSAYSSQIDHAMMYHCLNYWNVILSKKSTAIIYNDIITNSHIIVNSQ